MAQPAKTIVLTCSPSAQRCLEYDSPAGARSAGSRLHTKENQDMKNIGSSVIVVSVLLLAFSTAPPAAFGEQGENRERPWKVLHFFERGAGDLAFVDLGDPGPSIGDRLVFSNPLFDTDNRLIGRDGAECVIVRIDPTEPPERQQVVQCTISVQLADGQLTVQGLAQGTENYFAVTGGTGAYRKARGEVLARDIVPLQEAEITVWLYR
jgi:hypothetical protein